MLHSPAFPRGSGAIAQPCAAEPVASAAAFAAVAVTAAAAGAKQSSTSL